MHRRSLVEQVAEAGGGGGKGGLEGEETLPSPEQRCIRRGMPGSPHTRKREREREFPDSVNPVSTTAARGANEGKGHGG